MVILERSVILDHTKDKLNLKKIYEFLWAKCI